MHRARPKGLTAAIDRQIRRTAICMLCFVCLFRWLLGRALELSQPKNSFISTDRHHYGEWAVRISGAAEGVCFLARGERGSRLFLAEFPFYTGEANPSTRHVTLSCFSHSLIASLYSAENQRPEADVRDYDNDMLSVFANRARLPEPLYSSERAHHYDRRVLRCDDRFLITFTLYNDTYRPSE